MDLFLKKYQKHKIIEFFNNLKESGLIFYENNESLLKGFLFDPQSHIEAQLKDKSIGIVLTSNNKTAFNILKSSELNVSNLSFFHYESTFTDKNIAQFVEGKDFVLVDSTSYIPSFLQLFNRIALKRKIPWILVSCFRAYRGFIGPLFWGEETGCYSCYDKRVKSVLPQHKELLYYETYIDEKKTPTKIGNIEISFCKLVYTLAVIEVKKFLLSYGFPHTYKRLLEIEFDEYTTTWHNFYKVPFCPYCNSKSKLTCAPWLDAVSLEK